MRNVPSSTHNNHTRFRLSEIFNANDNPNTILYNTVDPNMNIIIDIKRNK